jgi:AraC family transcriptional regulator of adaptative response/methylated-DNA-[protein]-cysteine methyltransferase
MMTMEQREEDYGRIESAIRFIEAEALRQPSLAEIAGAAGLSEFHFQRLFSRWVGISPKRFLQFLTKEYARRLLQESRDVLSVSYDAGLSSPGRLHELFVTCEAVTPGEVKTRGEGLSIQYGFHPSPFGRCMVAVTERGICGLSFVQEAPEESLVRGLRARWPGADVRHGPEETAGIAERIFTFQAQSEPGPLHLFVRGTNFQIQVWEALIRIPFGKAVTYEDVARHIGMPNAPRAVGNAVGSNPIPFLIPCHRVIRKMGEFGNYGEGPQRKKAILGWEAALTHGEESA